MQDHWDHRTGDMKEFERCRVNAPSRYSCVCYISEETTFRVSKVYIVTYFRSLSISWSHASSSLAPRSESSAPSTSSNIPASGITGGITLGAVFSSPVFSAQTRHSIAFTLILPETAWTEWATGELSSPIVRTVEIWCKRRSLLFFLSRGRERRSACWPLSTEESTTMSDRTWPVRVDMGKVRSPVPEQCPIYPT